MANATDAPSAAVDVSPYLDALATFESEKERVRYYVIDALQKSVKGWSDVCAEDITVNHLSGAMTNVIFSCEKPSGENKKVLLRLYGKGTEIFFSREDEIHIFKMLSEKDLGVGLLGEFGNGRVEAMIDGVTLQSADIRDAFLSSKIAAKMFEFHQVEIDLDRTPRVIDNIRNFLEVAKKSCTSDEFKEIDFDMYDKYIDELQQLIAEMNSPIVLCHNDLQYGNIMKSSNNDIYLIDFEYSHYNPRGFDLGNHFSEWCYNYHSEKNPHVANWSKYPTIEQQIDFCKHYLKGKGTIQEVDMAEVEKLRQEANAYALASHLFWSLWGFIQSVQSEIEFDFFHYAKCRLEGFTAKKTML